MAETRYTVRYYSDAHVELESFNDQYFILKDISDHGCCLETATAVNIPKDKLYKIKIIPGINSTLEPFELEARSFWKSETSNLCQYGFKFLLKPQEKEFEQYLEYCKNGRYGKIKSKILKIVLATSLSAILLISIVTLLSIFDIRSDMKSQSTELGNRAASQGEVALEEQAKQNLLDLAEDKAKLTNEKLIEIQNQTKMVANIATHIFTYKDQYKPRGIDYLHADQIGTSTAHIRTASGIDINNIRGEVYRAANIVDILRQITVTDNGITSSYIGTESGYFIDVEIEAPGPAYRKNYDPRERAWYIGAKQKNGIFWTPLFADASGRGASMACALPFYDDSNGNHIFKGVAGNGTILSDNINKIIDSTKIGDTGYAFILNSQGQAISKKGTITYNTDSSGNIIGDDYLNSKNPDLRKLALQMVSGRRGLLKIEMDGQEVFAAYSPLIIIGWSLAIVVPISEVIQPAQLIKANVMELAADGIHQMNNNIFTLLLILVVVILATSLVIVIISGHLSDSLTAPITALCEGAKIIGNGDLNFKLRVKSGDEIEMLAEAFDLMVRNIKRITTETERISTELTVAATIQTNMLPSVEPSFSNRNEFEIFAMSKPAKEVGGDFYDFFMIGENKIAVLIADVSGKGVPAALFMVITKTLLKDHAYLDSNLNELFYKVNNILCNNNRASMFVSVFMGVLDINSGKLTYINAGHNPPLIKQKNDPNDPNKFRWLKERSGLVLAVMDDINYTMFETTLEKDDVLFLYTDGVNEAMNKVEEQYGNNRIIDTLNTANVKGARTDEYLPKVLASIEKFEDGNEQSDDITMLVLRYKGKLN